MPPCALRAAMPPCLLGVLVGPGGGLVVGDVVAKAAVEDADEPAQRASLR